MGLPVLHMVYMLLVSAELLRGGSDPDEVAAAREVGAILQEEEEGVLDGVLHEGEPKELLVAGKGPPPMEPGPIGPPPALIGRLGWPAIGPPPLPGVPPGPSDEPPIGPPGPPIGPDRIPPIGPPPGPMPI
jgi:hypothetical protein